MRSNELRKMQEEVVAYCVEKGWSGPDSAPVTFGDTMALLHSEVSEALEAYRSWGLKDATDLNNDAPVGYTPKPEGVGSEFADILIRLLDDCARYNIDLTAEFNRKMAYNRTRPYQHAGRTL